MVGVSRCANGQPFGNGYLADEVMEGSRIQPLRQCERTIIIPEPMILQGPLHVMPLLPRPPTLTPFRQSPFPVITSKSILCWTATLRSLRPFNKSPIRLMLAFFLLPPPPPPSWLISCIQAPRGANQGVVLLQQRLKQGIKPGHQKMGGGKPEKKMLDVAYAILADQTFTVLPLHLPIPCPWLSHLECKPLEPTAEAMKLVGPSESSTLRESERQWSPLLGTVSNWFLEPELHGPQWYINVLNVCFFYQCCYEQGRVLSLYVTDPTVMIMDIQRAVIPFMSHVSASTTGSTKQDCMHTDQYDNCPLHNVSITKDCSGVVGDCHGVTQNGSGSSSVTCPTKPCGQ
ncbi:hypothetical protein NFI96_029340, partial [Prochilodus magdalenae]